MKVSNSLKFLCLPVFAFLLLACERNSEVAEISNEEPLNSSSTELEDRRLADFFDELFERDLSQNPELQAQLGRKTEDYGRWSDYSDAFAQTENAQTEADLARLRSDFDYEALGESARVSYRIFEYRQEQDLRNFEWRFHRYAISPMNNIASGLPAFMQNIHSIETRQDAEDYISRLQGIETIMQQVVAALRRGEAIGVIPPMMVYPIVLPGAQSMLKGAPFDEATEDGILLTDFRGKIEGLGLDQEETDILINDAVTALSGPFRNGYQTLIRELLRLKNLADTDHGVWSLPDGEAFYVNRIQNWTTVTISPEELHQLGLAEVARIRAEMQKVIHEIGFKGDLAAFFEYVRKSPDNYYEDTEEGRQEYIREAKILIEGIYDIANDYFNVLPKAPLEVRRVEPWREAGGSTAFYSRPSPDGSRPGIYYINQQSMKVVQKHIMNTLAYHEGVPGHHFQIAIQQELQGLPQFRLYGGYTAYSEGWALYSERLAYEAGLYEGIPMRDFGRLSEEMKRAVRLVVDTGMHYKHWPLQQSIEYMAANTPMAPADIERQIKRYYVLPGQALAYKVGMLSILELRQQAMDQLGEDFDIREFHDAILKNGAVPLEVLDDVINDYIRTKKTGADGIAKLTN